MKRSKMKIAACIFSAAVLFAVVGGQGKSGEYITVVNATTQTQQVASRELSLQQLRDIALKIVPGTIVKEQYDYENAHRVIEFDIMDKNGIKRELTLYTSNGKVYDIDYDYDDKGNRFINKDLFEVNITFEQAQNIALKRVPGTVLAHKQDADYGLFIYEFIIKSNNGAIYEVDVETQNGTVIKVEIEDDYNPYKYGVQPVTLPGTSTTQQTTQAGGTTVTTQVSGTGTSQNLAYKSEAEIRKIVLSQYPGEVLYVKEKWKYGMTKYEYKIRQANGVVVEVEIYDNGYIKDVEHEGQYVNGVYYDWD